LAEPRADTISDGSSDVVSERGDDDDDSQWFWAWNSKKNKENCVPLSTAVLSKLQPTGRMWSAVQFCPASGRYL
jgi:hypothetical protein